MKQSMRKKKLRRAAKVQKKSWLARLVDMDDNSISASTVFMLVTTVVAILLLFIPAIVLIVEVCFNHTIMTDLSGMAAYIMAVTGIFTSGAALKGWTNYSNYKFQNSETKEAVKKLSAAVQLQMIDSIDASALQMNYEDEMAQYVDDENELDA